MENKKTKLTISGNPKKSFKNFESSKSKDKKTVFIDKKTSRPLSKGSFNKQGGFKSNFNNPKKNISNKSNFAFKPQSTASDFERRKLAEQRATKRLKDVSDKDNK